MAVRLRDAKEAAIRVLSGGQRREWESGGAAGNEVVSRLQMPSPSRRHFMKGALGMAAAIAGGSMLSGKPTRQANAEDGTGRFLPGVPGPESRQSSTPRPATKSQPGSSTARSRRLLSPPTRSAFFSIVRRPCRRCRVARVRSWPALKLALEETVRFPWRGGRHPVLDCLVTTPSTLIGIESKRYEPYRTKRSSRLSPAYWRPVWGGNMEGYERVRDGLRRDQKLYTQLDAAQLFKHAFALRTEVRERNRHLGLTPIPLLCLRRAGSLACRRKSGG